MNKVQAEARVVALRGALVAAIVLGTIWYVGDFILQGVMLNGSI